MRLQKVSHALKVLTILMLIGTGSGLFAKSLDKFRIDETQNNFSVVFPEDTIYACTGTVMNISPDVTGGAAPYTFLWSTGEQLDSISILHISAGSFTYTVSVTDAFSQTDTATVLVMAMAECIWPGDANGDGRANVIDLLTLGQTFGNKGPKRPNAHTNWIGQPGPSWGHHTKEGVEYVHSDSDGDGVIGIGDMLAIDKNYVPAPLRQDTFIGSGAPFSVQFPNGNANTGDTISAQINLGTATVPADSIYGIAFSLMYDPNLVSSGSLVVNFDSSWLGIEGQNMYGMFKDFPGQGRVDVSLTRIDQRMVKGYGGVGNIIIVIDDLSGKREGVLAFAFSLANVSLIQSNGTKVPVSPKVSEIDVEIEGTNSETLLPVLGLNMYPNPAQDKIYVTSSPSRLNQLNLYDISGRKVREWQGEGRNIKMLDVGTLENGWYTLEVWSGPRRSIKKLQISR
ncbi:MAG: T9SS type A sorting domain-containing protein [Bacteroidota bacterium]